MHNCYMHAQLLKHAQLLYAQQVYTAIWLAPILLELPIPVHICPSVCEFVRLFNVQVGA